MAITNLAWRAQGTADAWAGRSVRLNGLIMADESAVPEAALSLLREGYTTIKVKVGRQILADDIRMVAQLREMIGDRAMLRLDANRIWSLEQALAFGQAIGPEAIDYVEEPCANLAHQERFFQETGIAIALDESLLALEPEALPALTGVSALVLKPALLGALDRTLAFVHVAKARGIAVVFSSLFESPHALRFYAQSAYQCSLADVPQGLDTWRWFPDAGETLVVQEGRLYL
jgi:O-succinylbenzoate synthase